MIAFKKGQEEIVGFVVVVVLVVVAFVLFLGFSSRNPPAVVEKASLDLRHFLESARVFTTECKIAEPEFQDFKELIQACYTGKSCLSGEKACSTLNATAQMLLASAFPVGPDSQAKGSLFTIAYTEPPETKEDLLVSLSQGNCSSLSQRSAEDFFPLGSGQITLKMKLCY